MKKVIINIVIIGLLLTIDLHSQSMGIGDASDFTPDATALLELKSTQRGFLLPRMTRAQRVAIVSPANGLMVIQSDTDAGDEQGIYYYYLPDLKWYRFPFTAATTSSWLLAGNSGTDPATNFLGTADAVDFVIKTSNTEAARFAAAGDFNLVKSLTVGQGITVSSVGVDVKGVLILKNSDSFANSLTTSPTQAINIAYTLPATQGAANTVLVNNGSGMLSWTLPATASSVSFDAITSGVNTTALMTVGTGATLSINNSGIVQSNEFLGSGSTTTAVDLNTAEVNGILPVPNGGTGLNTIPTNALVYGNGTSAMLTLESQSGSYLTTTPAGALTWTPLGATNNTFWALLGNTGTNPVSNFIGTTDAQDLVFRTNNTERIRLLSGGNVGINATNPSQPLEITGNVLLSSNGPASAIMFTEPSASGVNYTSFQARAQSGNIAYTLPYTTSQPNSMLSNDGSNLLYWQSIQDLLSNIRYQVYSITASTTYTASLLDTHILITSSSSVVICLPTGSNLSGKVFFIKRVGSGDVTICPGSGRYIDQPSQSYIRLTNQGSSVMIISDGTNWFIMSTYLNTAFTAGSCAACP